MKKISKFIVRLRFVLIPIFVLLVCLCGYLSTQVSINYNILDYLSAESDSSVATDKLIQEFGSDGMAEVMVVDVSKEEANSIASAILEIDGVESVIFDDSNEYNYSSNNALFTVYLSYSDYDTKSYDVIDDICEMLDDKEIALGGTTIMARFLLEVMETDMIKIMLIATLVVFAILMLTSSSWVEPFLFLIIIFGAILINAGTNIIFGEISYITNSIAAVLQLALAMDYSIVLLHSYNKEKKLNSDNRVSMSNALAQSFKLISSSGLTTIAGLIALVFMSFSIGFDVGMVLAKGILVSLLSVLIFMPGLLLFFDKLMKKTAHRSIFDRMLKEKAMGEENQPNNQYLDNIPPLSSEYKYVPYQSAQQTKKSKHGISKEDKKLDKKIKKEIEKYDENNKQKYSRYERFVSKTRVIMPIILVAIFCFSAIANMNLDYYYYIETSNDETSTISLDATLIDDTFGSQNLLAIIVPSGDIDAENELAKSLYEYTYEDEAIVENILSISTLGLYDYYDAFSLSVLFGVTEDLMTGLFVEMNQESAMLCDILDYLTTSDYISSLILTMSDEVELYYNEMQALTTKVDCDTMAMYLGISSETAESIYAQMGGELEYSMQEVAQMVVEHDLATSMYSDIQAQLDDAYQNLIYLENASTSLTFEQACEMYYYIPSSTLSGIYGTNVTMTIGELITIFSYYEVATAVGTEMTESCQNVYSLFVQLSQDELMTLVTLPEEYISLMLADKNTLSTYELFEYMYTFDVISAFGDELIESLENYQVDASSAYSLFNSENYTRFIVQISIADTDENSYIAVGELKELTKEIYDEFYISGTSALYSDMSDDFSVDIVMINLISFLAIFLIIAITFKSLLIPIILSTVIQGSIWLNMGICMLTGNGLFFIVYVLVLCIQTGSTIDYAMLLTTKYTEHRITKNKLYSISSAMKDSLPTILTSGSILVLATLIIGLVSNMTIISSVGIMLARGTFISLTFISLFLPQILVLLDKPIEKTTLKYNPIH